MTRLAITVATFGALAVALAVGLGWFIDSPASQRWEPAVNTLALLAGLTGIFAERWAAERERRNQAVDSIDIELEHNEQLLADKAFSPDPNRLGRRQVYPRLMASAVDSAFASGSLSPRRDVGLIDLLHRWRGTVAAVNRRLDLTESLTFASTSDEEVEQFNRALHRDDGYLRGARDLLAELRAFMQTPEARTWRRGKR
jgi:hypothetical protein